MFATWRGEAAQAAKDAGTEKSTRMELSAQNAFRVWAGAGHAYEEAAAVKKELNDIFAEANAAPAVHIDTATNVVTPPDTSGWADEDVARATAKVEALQQKIASLLLTAEKADADLAAVLRAATAAESPVTEQSGDRPSDPNAPTAASTLADLGRANDQAVVDAMAKVKAAQKALDEASKDAYTHGAGSPEAQTARAKLPELKKNLATALDELGKVPDYSGIDPKSMSIGPDGKLLFSYSLNGQTMQVTGSLKNGTGEIFDQGSHAYYTYKDGQLVGTRILDEGRAIPNDELLQNAVFTAVGAGPTAMAGKAGAEVAWQGMRALFTREAVETGAGAAAGVTADNVLPRAVVQAEHRAELAAQNLADHAPVSHIPAGAVAEHPTPLPASEHPAPVHDHPLPSGEPHGSPVPTGDVAHAQLTDSVAPAPAFTLDNPLDHMSPQLQALSEQHLTGSGETVLGPFNPADGGQSYIQVAQERGASYFDIGKRGMRLPPPNDLRQISMCSTWQSLTVTPSHCQCRLVRSVLEHLLQRKSITWKRMDINLSIVVH
ncbi:hypothetical protein [Mycobacterium shimoidei]|uniref:hypothetical protein n=1 Tax=Mycobacterium shimoidei TaxID=29313 RepID=UPI00084915F2|nr:hypothetical protein [Mycobacterium shimoidei]MCV7261122.1 hypothetical protein [Mycobacterium shimoidei]ODR07206.1 hypothetical protein BHQ16_21405 [Mycobacterium shimoidei]ORW77396.1 hypothetical protein AWC26_19785 [Mycobacterium shimoidei]